MCTGFWRGNLKERDHLEGLDIDERIILKGILKNRVVWHGLDCCGFGQGQVAGVNAVMDLRVPYNARNF